MKPTHTFLIGLIVGAILTGIAFMFYDSNDQTYTNTVDRLKEKYELQLQSKIDSLELFSVTKQRAITIADSQIKRYVSVTPKLKDNIEFMNLDTVKEVVNLSRKDIAAISYIALELESCKAMTEEFPAILDKQTKTAHDRGKKEGLKKGIFIGAGGAAGIFLALVVL